MKLLTLASALALFGSQAFAATFTVHVAGSSAFRAATENAIVRALTSPTAAFLGSSLAGASQATFQGGVGADTFIVECAWTGSASGVQTVQTGAQVSITFNGTAGDTTHVWISAAGNTFAAATVGASGPTGGQALTAATAAYDPAAAADWGMTDVFQATTPFKGTLVDTRVGVVPFKFCVNNGAPVSLANITPQLAQALFSNQFGLPLALFTGLNADETKLVFPIGRDADSGTRLASMAESRVGTTNLLLQQAPMNAAGQIIGLTYSGVVAAGPVASQDLFPAAVINGISYSAGDTGYASGGQLANALKATGSLAAVGGYYLSYLGLNDAASAITGGAHELTYNGVAYSATAVQEGQYTFWSYEHLIYKTSYTGTPKTFADTVANNIITTDAPISGLALSSMKVVRSNDGGLVTNNY